MQEVVGSIPIASTMAVLLEPRAGVTGGWFS